MGPRGLIHPRPPHSLPQGLVLGPLLYIIYTSELGSLLIVHDVLGQLYADDILAYLHCLASNAMAAVRAMTLAKGAWWPGCRQIVCGSIHLRPSTSEWAHASGSLSWIPLLLLSVLLLLSSQLLFEIWESPWVRSSLLLPTLTAYAATATTSCVSSAFSTATLVHAFVTARLDYCATLYAGLPTLRLRCLERAIRTAARLIGGIPRTGHVHVTAYMLDVLHWLPLQQRIIFRIGALVWRCILGLAPA